MLLVDLRATGSFEFCLLSPYLPDGFFFCGVFYSSKISGTEELDESILSGLETTGFT
jgi:hypothetical protein